MLCFDDGVLDWAFADKFGMCNCLTALRQLDSESAQLSVLASSLDSPLASF